MPRSSVNAHASLHIGGLGRLTDADACGLWRRALTRVSERWPSNSIFDKPPRSLPERPSSSDSSAYPGRTCWVLGGRGRSWRASRPWCGWPARLRRGRAEALGSTVDARASRRPPGSPGARLAQSPLRASIGRNPGIPSVRGSRRRRESGSWSTGRRRTRRTNLAPTVRCRERRNVVNSRYLVPMRESGHRVRRLVRSRGGAQPSLPVRAAPARLPG